MGRLSIELFLYRDEAQIGTGHFGGEITFRKLSKVFD